MKKLAAMAGSLLLIGLTMPRLVRAQDDFPLVMDGSEQPEFHTAGESGECYVYAKYVIKTAASEDGGADVSVYKRDGASAENSCETSGEAWLYVNNSDNNSFSGLTGKFIFIDMGTSADSRDVAIYDLTLHKSVLTLSYSGELKVTGGRYLLFDSPSSKKGVLSTCKDAAKWKKEGGGVGWVQGKKLDLQTLPSVNVGSLRCVYME